MEKFRVNIGSNFRFQLQRTRDRKKQERNPHMASPLTATSSIIIILWATVKQRRKRRFICVNLSLPYLVAKKKVRRTYSLSPVVVKVEVCVTDAGESEEREGDRRMELFFLLLLIKNLIVVLYRSKPKRYPTKNGSRWWRTTCAATAS